MKIKLEFTKEVELSRGQLFLVAELTRLMEPLVKAQQEGIQLSPEFLIDIAKRKEQANEIRLALKEAFERMAPDGTTLTNFGWETEDLKNEPILAENRARDLLAAGGTSIESSEVSRDQSTHETI